MKLSLTQQGVLSSVKVVRALPIPRVVHGQVNGFVESERRYWG